MINRSALITATVRATILQIIMVVAGHYRHGISDMFPILGTLISLVAGLRYAKLAGPATYSAAAVGGLLAGGICALIGIAISCAMGDVQPSVLLFGTGASAVAGALGGVIGKSFYKRPPAATTT